MQLSELQTFLTIIEAGSLVRASQRLNVTQSTVTARLKSLELELGQTLINRQKSGASLTAAGVRLQRYATTISELWRQAQQEIALPDAFNTVCNFGCHSDLWTGMGERLFEHIRSTVPNIAISVSMGSHQELAELLEDGLIDLSLSYGSNPGQSQEVISVATDRLILVSTLEDGPVRFDPNYTFIEAGEEFGRLHAVEYSDAGTARFSFNNAQLGLNYILKCEGSAYLPERIAKEAIENAQLFKLVRAPEYSRQIYLTVNKSAKQTWDWFDESLRVLTETETHDSPISG